MIVILNRIPKQEELDTIGLREEDLNDIFGNGTIFDFVECLDNLDLPENKNVRELFLYEDTYERRLMFSFDDWSFPADWFTILDDGTVVDIDKLPVLF